MTRLRLTLAALLTLAGATACAEMAAPSERDIEAAATCTEPLRRATTMEAVLDTAHMRAISPFIDASPRDEIQWQKAYAWPLCMAVAGFRCEGEVGPPIPSAEDPPGGPDILIEKINRPSATCSRDSGSIGNPFGQGLRLR